MRFFLSWCLWPTAGNDVLASDDLHLVARGGGGAVRTVAATGERGVGHGSGWPWRQGRVGWRGEGWPRQRGEEWGDMA